jgi:predicted ATP-binding protein involved in virulence
MPLMRLIAENIGPFERLDIDFSDGNGKAHRGPHILAGVNGSGKSTVLRAIAWALSWGGEGFPEREWQHFLRGNNSRVAVHVAPSQGPAYVVRVIPQWDNGWDEVDELAARLDLLDLKDPAILSAHAPFRWTRFGQPPLGHPFTASAYAPVRALSYIDTPASAEQPTRSPENSFGFESTIQNSAIQRWWVDLFSRRALAKERGQEFGAYEETLARLQDAVKLICDDSDINLDVEFGPIIEPRVVFHGKKLNFSQLSDGVRSTVGWIADFMMRQDKGPKTIKEGLLLLDEIDIYLHPKWQRTLLPAMRKALPDVQIIASSHSPFVISSCPDARIHVLELDGAGVAHACPPQAAPFGESVTATLKDIFGVESRFDVQTEEDLKKWDELKREEAVGKLTQARRKRLEGLTGDLSERSEELRMIVGSPGKLSANILNSLTGLSARKPSQVRSPKRNGTRALRSKKLR